MADARPLGRVIRSALEDAPSSPFEADELESDPALLGEDLVLGALDGSELLFCVEGPRAELAGCLRVVPREFLRAGHIGVVQLLLRPASRRRGLGRAALAALMGHRAVTSCVARLEVQVSRFDVAHMALMAALGPEAGWRIERVEHAGVRRDGAFCDILTWVADVPRASETGPTRGADLEARRDASTGRAAGWRGAVGGFLGITAAAAATWGASGCAAGLNAGASSPSQAVEVLGGPRFWTGDSEAPWADWIAVDAAGRVADFGLGPRPLTRRLRGDLAVPGLADHHAHLGLLGRAVETVALGGLGDVGAIQVAVRRHAEAESEAGLVAGFGWDLETALAPGFRAAEALGGLDPRGRPIALTRADGHAVWLDAVGLAQLAARSLLSDAGGQRVLRDADGAPTGLILDPTLATWEALRDEGDGRAARRIARGLGRLMAEGVVEVHAMATPVGDLPAIVAARETLGEAAPGVVAWLEDTPEARAWLAARPGGLAVVGPGVVVRGLKLFADGALGSRGAALREAYCDAHEAYGHHMPREALARSAREAIAAGFDVAIHAIGDRAVEVALDALETASDVSLPSRAYRHRIEHAQLTTPADRARMARMGVIASMQPIHACSDAPWAPARLGPDRLAGAYAAAAMREAGVALVFGSDAPLDAPGLLAGLRAAVTRRCDPQTAPPPDWLTEQAIPLEAALQAYGATEHASPAGRIAVGAPLTLSLFAVPPDAGPMSLACLLHEGTRVVGTCRTGHAHVLGWGALWGSCPNV